MGRWGGKRGCFHSHATCTFLRPSQKTGGPLSAASMASLLDLHQSLEAGLESARYNGVLDGLYANGSTGNGGGSGGIGGGQTAAANNTATAPPVGVGVGMGPRSLSSVGGGGGDGVGGGGGEERFDVLLGNEVEKIAMDLANRDDPLSALLGPTGV